MIIFTIRLDPEPDQIFSDPDQILFSDPDPLKQIISDPGGSGSSSTLLSNSMVLLRIFAKSTYDLLSFNEPKGATLYQYLR